MRMFLLSLLLSNSVLAADARARLEAFANGLNALSGEFSQTTSDANGEVQEESRGTLALAAPRQFRWQYDDPFPQLIVADGNNVWIHDEDLEQVTVRNQSTEESQSPLTVLVDPDEEVGSIGSGGNSPQRMLLEDLLGNRTEWAFSKWLRNPTLAVDTFKFVPPAGVDVIGEAVEPAQAIPLQ